MKTINPLSPDPENNGENSAANLIRNKLNSIYSTAPDAIGEVIQTSREPESSRSKHQRFMADLAASGKPFAVVQTEWHDYYQNLDDKGKHEVWNEFYAAQEDSKPAFQPKVLPPKDMINPSEASQTTSSFKMPAAIDIRKHGPESVANLRRQLTGKVRARGKISRKGHLKSMAFGLGVGVLFLLIMSFGFFNERIIAPFITPSKAVADTPLISASGSVGSDPKLIIPKINVELPVVYDVETIQEKDIQKGLEHGVVHYPTTSSPGEKGNGVIFGHSSNNILNRGDYKFAFVLLNRLRTDDTFYIEKDGVRYVYKVFDRRIVSPNEVSVLGNVPGKTSTMALITCDPPGTALKRLVVWGEQISPDPANNTASTALQTDDTPVELAGNAPSLWSRIWNSIF